MTDISTIAGAEAIGTKFDVKNINTSDAPCSAFGIIYTYFKIPEVIRLGSDIPQVKIL